MHTAYLRMAVCSPEHLCLQKKEKPLTSLRGKKEEKKGESIRIELAKERKMLLAELNRYRDK